jgi:hypothetical protein
MMECKEVREKLSAYIEGIVPAAEKPLMEEHLRACTGCKESLADLKRTIEYVQEIPEVEPPPWLTQKVMARVRAEAETEAEARKGIWEKLFHRAPAWQTERALPTISAKPGPVLREKTFRKRIWDKLLYPIPIKLPLEAAGVIAIAVVIIYVFREIQPQMQFSKAPLEGMKSPAISEVRKPVAPPSSMQESEKTISDKSIEAKRAMPSGQPAPRRQAETPASLPAPSPTPAPAPAPAERYKEVGPTAGAGVKGQLAPQAPSGKESGQLVFDAVKERDQLRPNIGAAKPEAEVLAKKSLQPPVAPERPAVQAPPSAEKENRPLPYAGMKAKKDESKIEILPTAPREEQASMERAKEKSARLAVSAAPRAKALAEKEEPGIRLTLTVQDIKAARSEIEKALAELGGRVIKVEPSGNEISLTAELSSNQREALLNKLKVLGEVKGGVAEFDAKQGPTMVVRIEIAGR